jgi:hypothetical protein
MIKLSAKPHDDLNWKIEGTPSVFEFDLGLHEPYFPIEDELYFNALAAALTQFTKEVWPRFPDSRAILFRGKADFSTFFRWTESQEANYEAWKENLAPNHESHLKRLFCAEAFVAYFQMLAHRLPDELPLTLIIDPINTGTLAQTLHLLSPERFEHFRIESGFQFDSNIGICFPPDSECSEEIIAELDGLLNRLPSFKPVYENLLTEQWDGLDEIYVIPKALTQRGKRKLMGFEAAGGRVIFGAEGFEPPTYWSQTSRASQTALCPDKLED